MEADRSSGGAFTLGVEEEYHLVDERTFALASAPQAVAHARAILGSDAQAEISTTQLEVSTPVCSSLAEVRQALVRARAGAAQGAARAGCRILVSATHPTGTWQEQRLTSAVRYIDLLERWGLLALQQGITGCHVHVGVPDRDTAVAVMDHSRPYLAVLRALTGSSPYWEATDTGYDSYRTQWYDRWPVTGVPDVLGTARAYDELVDRLVATGFLGDASYLYWDVRPSLRWPTVEFRMADVCTELDDAVLYAALVRSLTRTLAGRASRGEAPMPLQAQLLRSARWRAARYGLSDTLVDHRDWSLRPAAEVVRGLVAELRADLEEYGEYDEVAGLVEDLLGRGTSAQRQRDVLARSGGDLDAVTRWIAEVGVDRAVAVG
ncbi:MAG: glutamate--cysteine ligase [Actinomycetota bacterium]|nr:glutamate--cysteine ligase [Actinomycetota bacterium]